MGLEAARYFVRLDAAKVILAVRNLSKGEAAKASIEASEKRLNVVEVWELDLARYASVKAFASRAQTLERLDAVIENAGIYTFEYTQAEENEATITVNVVSTFLLALNLLPKLRETAVKFEKVPVLSFTGSFVHFDTKFPERKESNIFEGLAKEKGARMNDRYVFQQIWLQHLAKEHRYNVSKMIELLCFRELAKDVTKSPKQRIIVSLINPGFVKTDIMREMTGLHKLYMKVMQKTLSRPTEVGGRILVSAAEGGDETHGQYLDDCKPGK
jgi:NAD(P)-dependent dehydrogenase (short-subunit alcohol dehydrogenase family)